MLISFHSSFLMFIILLPSFKSSTSARRNNTTITDELIHKICSGTRNPSLCLNNLKSSKGKSLLPNSLAAIGSNFMNMVLSHANVTAGMIWRRYSGTMARNHEMRLRYHKCSMMYTVDVKNQLTEANEYMLSGAAKSVKKCVFVAGKRVSSCDQELMKMPREQSGTVLEANGVLKDLCSIIVAVCDTVPR